MCSGVSGGPPHARVPWSGAHLKNDARAISTEHESTNRAERGSERAPRAGNTKKLALAFPVCADGSPEIGESVVPAFCGLLGAQPELSERKDDTVDEELHTVEAGVVFPRGHLSQGDSPAQAHAATC